ncbi:hypothetical protein AGABI1DRAFT_61608 [Agaricus bisporus var. burnettii JB137-S8]|uniref:Uncharacterized protein n=1 Tax=Agaricus bisporus var. burnettii (strain JB137-S8 / ATCC MYA-4627 / FGSC 10392) TaxID=597362 RepID=K5WQ93_AGABU|nr:uncharacterized protein AGABI1DRAFT_61608 [Agaricus bisporus var. burnettii JB137-S8]EKM77521.1 hypothetical protein AGABI1DRAFT_61608 [Agaricus bisporus var. burnettii JB137-S8]
MMDMDIDQPIDLDIDHEVIELPDWVMPPTQSEIDDGLYDLHEDDEGIWIVYDWKDDNPDARIEPFYQRWPPSRTSSSLCSWINVNRGLSPASQLDQDAFDKRFHMDIEGLQKEFVEIENKVDTEELKLTPEMIDELAVKYGVLSGKWLVYASSEEVDKLWRKIVGIVTFDREYGSVKVSSRKVLEPSSESSPSATECNGGVPDPDEGHVICVYVEDYLDMDEVNRLRKALRFQAGVFKRIGFKPDVYTWLGLYRGNKFGIRPSKYHDSDNWARKK